MGVSHYVGWDIGGAHLKAAYITPQGEIVDVVQRACPLWRGLACLHEALDRVLTRWRGRQCSHAVTMTGELADVFADRGEGVRALIASMVEALGPEPVWIYAGRQGLLTPASAARRTQAVASANWCASASLAARAVVDGIFVDVGSTTSDVLALSKGQVAARGHNDHTRLSCDELLCTGVARTPVMALAGAVPFGGAWIELMAERFATSADVYRLTGELPAHADLMPTADGADKSPEASARRLARMLGLDAGAESLAAWRRVAEYLAERQLRRLLDACAAQLSRGLIGGQAPLVGAGVGRFLAQRLAARLARPYVDFAALCTLANDCPRAAVAECAPAVAVAELARAPRAS